MAEEIEGVQKGNEIFIWFRGQKVRRYNMVLALLIGGVLLVKETITITDIN